MKYIGVVQWSADRSGIRLEMLGEDQETHHFEISSECAGVLASALAAESQKFNVETNELQFIRPTGMQTGKTHDGEPVLFMALKGGAELPLVFKPETLGVLITELERLRGALQGDSQIRWQ